jgi:hypothetical protein
MPCPDVSPISCADLLASFAELPDPRRRRGVRHEVQAILAIAAAAVVAGARSFTAIGEWADEAPQQVLAALGARLDPDTGAHVAPHEATLRRTIQAFDLAISALRLAGHNNIAAALRWAARDTTRPLTIFGINT